MSLPLGSFILSGHMSPGKRVFVPYFVYILFSEKADRYYVGETDDIGKRLNSHLSGVSSYTSQSDDWICVYREEFKTRTEAIRREKEIKRKKSRNYIEWLIKRGS